MDFIKVQIEILKQYKKIKDRKLPERNLVIGSDKFYTYVVINACAVVVIPNGKYYLDLSMVNNLSLIQKAISLKGIDGDEAVLTGEMIKGKKGTYRKLHTEKHDVYINQKWEKLFPFDDCKFVTRSSTSPVYLYEKGAFVGVLMPVMV